MFSRSGVHSMTLWISENVIVYRAAGFTFFYYIVKTCLACVRSEIKEWSTRKCSVAVIMAHAAWYVACTCG